MSYLNVTNVSHSFGGRQILENVSFKLMRGEHVGLVGANGEGKSTFLNIVTGHTLPDEGKVEWPGKVTVGYLDQQSTLQKGMTIREVLRTAFDGMYKMEAEMLELYEKMGDATPEEMDKMMETVGEIQTELEHGGFYSLDSKIEETANGLGLGSIGLDRDVAELSGGQRQRLLLASVLAVHPEIIVLDEPVSAMDPDGANSLYKLLYKIHKEYGTTIVVVEHRIDYLLPYMTDLVVLKKGRLVAADKFENAARVMYKDETLRHFVPALWRIKLGLEEKFGVSLGNWRTEEEAVAELKAKGFTGGEA